MEVLRYTAFSGDPAGGNPAGVVLEAAGESAAEMQRVAAEVGYSETAFLVAGSGADREVRYFSPLAEVPFCGHATIATAVAHAHVHGPGDLHLATRAGRVDVTTRQSGDGAVTATLTSVAPRTRAAAPARRPRPAARGAALAGRRPRRRALAAAAGLRRSVASGHRGRVAASGWPISATTSRRSAALMAERDWTTVQLVWRESYDVFHARNPFPPGGVVEDPATGAAAAALGGYLRDLALVTPPADRDHPPGPRHGPAEPAER